ncbi:uncharacterized protein LOC142355756 isoform X2 [Convolutriloba macropyga]|uniref:uncharacterized protein LOC142355756 isoform X2 n=1 Tax=Convolutriloba macropyga TaxID=536237 RepID=UPI003F525779
MEPGYLDSTLQAVSFSPYMPSMAAPVAGSGLATGAPKAGFSYCDFLLPEPLASDSLSDDCSFLSSHEGMQSACLPQGLDQADQAAALTQTGNANDLLVNLKTDHQLLDFEDCCTSQWYCSGVTDAASNHWTNSPSSSSEDDMQSVFDDDAFNGLCGSVFNTSTTQAPVEPATLDAVHAPEALTSITVDPCNLPPLRTREAPYSGTQGQSQLFSNPTSVSPSSNCSMGTDFFHESELAPTAPSVATSPAHWPVTSTSAPPARAGPLQQRKRSSLTCQLEIPKKRRTGLSPAAVESPRVSIPEAAAAELSAEDPASCDGNGTGYRFWSLAETRALVEGVRKCGTGKWAEIKKLSFAAIEKRSAVDLKDKWRNLTRIAKLPPAAVKQDKKREITCPPDLLDLVRELAKLEEAKKLARAQGRAVFGRAHANRRGRPTA